MSDLMLGAAVGLFGAAMFAAGLFIGISDGKNQFRRRMDDAESTLKDLAAARDNPLVYCDPTSEEKRRARHALDLAVEMALDAGRRLGAKTPAQSWGEAFERTGHQAGAKK